MIDLDKKLKQFSFFRAVIVSALGYYKDNIKNVVVKDGEVIEEFIPFNLSKNGDPQYIEDFFLDKDLECKNDKVNGDTNAVPSGLLSIDDISVDDASMLNTNNAAIYKQMMTGDFFDEYKERFTRIDIIPIVMTGKLSIKSPTVLSSFIISENLLDLHYKVRNTMVSYGGFDKIPVSIEMGNKIGKAKKRVGFKTGDKNTKHQEIETDIKITTYYLVKNRVIDYNTSIKTTEINTEVKE